MKNLILTTVSVLAISAFAVQAEPTNNMNDKSSQTESQSSSLATDGNQPMTETSSSSTMGSTTAAVPSAPTGQRHGAPHAKHPGHHVKHHGAHHGEHHGHHAKHQGHHAKHHAHMGHPQYPNQANIGGVFVTFPPMDLGDTCRPEFYAGRTECPYVCHGGYFWYPHANATLLNGYNPSLLRGMYWYPSYMHPYAVYTQRAPVTYTLPYVLSKPLPSDSAMYKAQTAPMHKKWDSAPEMMPGQEN